MLCDIDVRPAEVRTFLRTLIEIPGNDAWRKRERDFDLQVRANPIVERYLDQQFGIERSMIRVRRYEAKTGRLPDPSALGVGPLYGFAAMVTRTYRRLAADAQRQLARRICGAMKDSVGLAPLDFEMRTVQHFMSRGFDVEFSDLHQGGGYDFTMRKEEVELEVECKAISGDLGRKIHLVRQYHLGAEVFRRLPPGKHGFVRLSIATVRDRLFPGKDFIETVASRIAASCSNEAGTDDEVCSVSYHEFPISPSHSIARSHRKSRRKT